MSTATTAAIACAAAGVATSGCASRNLHPTKYDGWILFGIVAAVVGVTMLGYFWPW